MFSDGVIAVPATREHGLSSPTAIPDRGAHRSVSNASIPADDPMPFTFPFHKESSDFDIGAAMRRWRRGLPPCNGTRRPPRAIGCKAATRVFCPVRTVEGRSERARLQAGGVLPRRCRGRGRHRGRLLEVRVRRGGNLTGACRPSRTLRAPRGCLPFVAANGRAAGICTQSDRRGAAFRLIVICRSATEYFDFQI